MPTGSITGAATQVPPHTVIGYTRAVVGNGPQLIQHVGVLSPVRPGCGHAGGSVSTSQPIHCDHVTRHREREDATDGARPPTAERVVHRSGYVRLLDMMVGTNDDIGQRGQTAVSYGHAGQPPSASGHPAVEAFIGNTEHKRFTFVCVPPIEYVDQAGGDTDRYSCVGFVVQCYRLMGIELLRGWHNNAAYPQFDADQLADIWPEAAWLFREPRLFHHLEKLGFSLDQVRWSVVVPGYVLHALNQGTPPGRTPFQPSAHSESRF